MDEEKADIVDINCQKVFGDSLKSASADLFKDDAETIPFTVFCFRIGNCQATDRQKVGFLQYFCPQSCAWDPDPQHFGFLDPDSARIFGSTDPDPRGKISTKTWWKILFAFKTNKGFFKISNL